MEPLEPRLLLSFTDVTSSVFIGGQPSSVGQNAAAWADFNNDGWVDLYDGSQLFRNNKGKLHKVEISGINQPFGFGTWGDYNNDGLVDLSTGSKLYRNVNGKGTFADVSHLLPSLPLSDYYANVWGDFNNDSYLDLYLTGNQSASAYYPDFILFNNRGNGFTKVWQEPSARPGRSALTADFDRDADLDIYITNYRLTPNYLFRNNGNGTFADVAGSYGATGSNGHGQGSAWGDMDNDGWLDLFAGNFSHPGQPASEFLRNRGPGGGHTFQVMNRLNGPDWQESYSAPALGDQDNDGDLDLFITTVYGGDAGRLYQNNGNWQFVNATATSGLNPNTGGTQAGWADFDNDGDLDLMTGASGRIPGRLYRNNGNNNNWLKVKLVGGGPINHSAIGSQVRIKAGNHTQVAQVEAQSSFGGNANDPTLHFGLDKFKGNVSIEVFWSNGKTQNFTAKHNQTNTYTYSKGGGGVLIKPEAVVTGADSAFVYWSPVSGKKGKPATYELQYRKDDKSDDWSASTSTIGSSAFITDLVADTAYRIRVRALIGTDTGNWAKANNLFRTGSFNPSTLTIGEVGALTDLSHSAQTVTLNHTYRDPVVFAQSPSNTGSEPVSVRVTDVQPDQFSIYLTEPSNKDGQSNGVAVSYLVLESGTHELVDGRRLEVGTVQTDATVGTGLPKVWETITYDTPFADRPVLLSQIQTDAGTAFLNVRKNVGTKSDFSLALQPEEKAATPQTAETVGYLAVESGLGWSGLSLEAFTTAKEVTNKWHNLPFNLVYEDAPRFLSSLATSGTIDNANLRYRKLNSNEVDVKVQEDTTADKETKHGKEKVSYLVIGGSGLILAIEVEKPPTQPGPPSATVLGTDSAMIEWGAASDPDDDPVIYELQFRPYDISNPWSSPITTSNTSVTLSELDDYTAYDVRLRASDGTMQSKWVTADDLFTTELNIGQTAVIGEVGHLTQVTHVAQTVPLGKTYVNPVVFAQSPSNNGAGPVALRVTDVQPNQFAIYLAEPSNEDGIHNKAVSVTYLVLESGTHELVDDRLLEVGTVDMDATIGAGPYTVETVPFTATFTERPVVLTQIQTDAGAAFLYTRQEPGTATEFSVALQQEEAVTKPHDMETVGYLAVEAGRGWSGMPFEAFTTPRKVTSDWYTIQFDQNYNSAPNFLSSLATVSSIDNANLRYRKLNSNEVDVKVQEDTTADKETKHGKEKVSYLALGDDGQVLARVDTVPPIDPTPPTDPGLPRATAIGLDYALLEWTASMDANHDPITYEVQYRKNNRSEPWSIVFTTSVNALTLTNLDTATAYRVKIRAYDGELGSQWIKVNRLFRTAVT